MTGKGVELDKKQLYAPQKAQERLRQQARHFVSLVVERLAAYHADHKTPGLIVSAYDTELYGHWWFEGIDWMKEVLRQLATNPDVELTTAGSYIAAYPSTEVLNLRESSWGSGGGHWTWLNPETEWMWPLIHGAERRMEKLVARFAQADGELLVLLNQTATGRSWSARARPKSTPAAASRATWRASRSWLTWQRLAACARSLIGALWR